MSRVFFAWNTFLQSLKRKNGLIEDLMSKKRVSLNDPLNYTNWGPLMCRNFAKAVQDNLTQLNKVNSVESTVEKLRNILQLQFVAIFVPKLKAMNRIPKTVWLRLVETNLRKSSATVVSNQKDVTEYLQKLDMPIQLDPALVSLWTGKPEFGHQLRRLQAAEARFMNEFKDLCQFELCVFEPAVDNVDFAYKTRKAVISAQKTGHLYIPVNLGNLKSVLRGTNSLKLRQKLLDDALYGLQKRQGPAEECLLDVLRQRRNFATALGFSSWSELVNTSPSVNSVAGKKETLSTQQMLLQRQVNIQQSSKSAKSTITARKQGNKAVVTHSGSTSPFGLGGASAALANGASIPFVVQELIAAEVRQLTMKHQGSISQAASQSSEAAFYSTLNPIKSIDELSQYLTTDGLVPRLIPALARVCGLEAERMRAGPAKGWHPNFDAFQVRMNSQMSGGIGIVGFIYVRPFAEKRHFSRRFVASNSSDEDFTSDLLLSSNSGALDSQDVIKALTPSNNEYDTLDRSVVQVIAPGHVVVDLRLPAQKFFSHMDMPPETLHHFGYLVGEAFRRLLANPELSVPSILPHAARVFAAVETMPAWLVADSIYSNQVFLAAALKSNGMMNQLKSEDVEAFRPCLADLQIQVSDCLIDSCLHGKAPATGDRKPDPLLSVEFFREAVKREAQKMFPFALHHQHSIFSLLSLNAFKPEEAGRQSSSLTGRLSAFCELKKPDFVRFHNLSLTSPAPVLSVSAMDDLKTCALRDFTSEQEFDLQRKKKSRGEQYNVDEGIEQFALKPAQLVNEDVIQSFVKHFVQGGGKGQKAFGESQKLLN